jgi:hypothetical protein
MSVGELAAYISSHLRQRGIDVVLTGGACVTIYGDDKYVSKALDFIETRFARPKDIRDAMAEIGFTPENRYFTNPETNYLVEFPTGPLSVGKEPVGRVNEIEYSTGVLRILSPTDCVKDRLAAYYHWKDLQSLEQALLVAKSHDVDLKDIARWSKHEGMAEKFAAIAKRFDRW